MAATPSTSSDPQIGVRAICAVALSSSRRSPMSSVAHASRRFSSESSAIPRRGASNPTAATYRPPRTTSSAHNRNGCSWPRRSRASCWPSDESISTPQSYHFANRCDGHAAAEGRSTSGAGHGVGARGERRHRSGRQLPRRAAALLPLGGPLPRLVDDAAQGADTETRHHCRRLACAQAWRFDANEVAALRGGGRPGVRFSLRRQGPDTQPTARSARDLRQTDCS